MFHATRQGETRIRGSITRLARFAQVAWVTLLVVTVVSSCRFGENIASPPEESGGAGGAGAAGGGVPTPSDGGAGGGGGAAPPCTGATDGDGDGMPDCQELGDGDDFTDPAIFNGFHVIAGEAPVGWGKCDALGDYAQMESRFDAPAQEMDVYAGWEFDTGADSYTDPSFNFAPSWPEQASAGSFSLRYRGQLRLSAGAHCLRIDIGATTDEIAFGRNACGQIYLGAGGPPERALAETGFGAATQGPATGCVDVSADGAYELDIVFWFFDVTFQTAKLEIRHCTGAACLPDQPVTPSMVQAR